MRTNFDVLNTFESYWNLNLINPLYVTAVQYIVACHEGGTVAQDRWGGTTKDFIYKKTAVN